jgi:hypothetical protein
VNATATKVQALSQIWSQKVKIPARFAQAGAFRQRDETIFAWRRSAPETKSRYDPDNRTEGLDHVGIGPQPHLPRVSQTRPVRHRNTGRKAMIEVVAAFLIFVSIGVFLAHAFDAYRLR